MFLPDGQSFTQLFEVVATLNDGAVLKEIKSAKTERQAMLRFLRELGTEMHRVVAIDAEAVA